MKNKLFIILSLFCSLQAWAQEGGIQFQKDAKWNDLLAKAKAENKLIFMDAYAVWCGPCKMMDSKVFSQAEAGTFFNANFVNAKFDMEKGEGLELAKTYEVRAYPTLLFIDGDGKIAHRILGYHELEEFMQLSKVALDPGKRLAGLEKRFDAGERNPQFIAEVMQAFEESMHPRATDVMDVYLESQQDWTTPKNIPLVVQTTRNTDSKQFQFLLNNRAAAEKALGSSAYLITLAQIVLHEAFPNMRTEGPPSTEALMKALKAKLPTALAEQVSLCVEMTLYREQDDMKNYAVTAVAYFKKYPSEDYNQLSEEAWAFYELVDDKKMLQEALKWAQKSVRLNSQYFNNDTLASLYYKLGEKKKAKKAAEKAIELAKANDEDFAATQELLDKINKM